jgi:hypothetical protein
MFAAPNIIFYIKKKKEESLQSMRTVTVSLV